MFINEEWLDERLEWNSSKYNNLDKLRIPCSRLWVIIEDKTLNKP